MSREEFMKELEYLLSDIPDEEKADAVGYYSDYLEEAGPENEEAVIAEFGSPERIASIIRSDLAGHLEEGGEFTETGYMDERFRDPNYQVANRFELPEVKEEPETSQKEHSSAGAGDERQPWTNKTLKTVLWIILIVVAAPVVFSVCGGVIGMLGGLFGILVAAVVLVGVLTAAMLLAGIGLLIGGVVCTVVNPANGIFMLGIGILCLGLGLLGVVLCFVFYGRFLPFLLRSISNLLNGLLHRRRKSYE